MVGLIQKLFFKMAYELGGEDAVISIKKEAGVPVDKDFQINIVYSDEEWQRILAAGLKILNVTPEQADVAYADCFAKDALERFPNWFQMSKNSYEFLLIQPTIHNCFATAVVDANERKDINDKFKVDKLKNKIITHYVSPNKLCGLYKALAEWMINHYKDEADIEEVKCLKKGDKECEIHIQWSKLNGQPVEA